MRFVHFANDTTVFVSDSDINNVYATVNRELVRAANWLKTNRVKTKQKFIYDNLQPKKHIHI